MHIFEQIASAIRNSLVTEKLPVIIFDLDDTLIDCRHRKHLVTMEFIQEVQIKQNFPAECAKLAGMDWQRMQYRVLDTLRQEGINSPEFGELLFRYWRQRYFTYPYLLQDRAFHGALDFVLHCHRLGAVVVYLTGRDEPGMGLGTRDSLQQLGFPVAGPSVHFILKTDPLEADLDFKVAALEKIAPIGQVIAALENELINLNAMATRFPEAAVYWRKTLYLPNPPEPHPRVQTLLAFT